MRTWWAATNGYSGKEYEWFHVRMRFLVWIRMRQTELAHTAAIQNVSVHESNIPLSDVITDVFLITYKNGGMYN